VSGVRQDRPVELDVDRALRRGRTSLSTRVRRWRAKWWQIGQCAIAAAVALWLAGDVLGHQKPFFAPIAAVVSLGTSYGQRLRRVAEVTIGVALGVFVADLLVAQIGTGWWQIMLIVSLAMSVALLLHGGQIFVTQAAVQSIVVTTLLPNPGAGFTRWTDALIGGGVALVAATAVPAAPLRRPRAQAAIVVRKVADLLRASAEARSTDYLIRELQDAAAEGLAVVASSPFRVRHRPGLRQMSELVEPLDRALRSTRVLVRHVAVCAYQHRPIPASYAHLADDVAAAADEVAAELEENRMAVEARDALVAVGMGTARVERSEVLSAEVVLAQLRSTIADLLVLTGLDALEATDLLPPPPDLHAS
jgi:uncharacterized membrane protein YgaE (UPF0421/DUF939 family)